MEEKTYYYPAEWEKHKAIWLAFPHNKKNWYGEREQKIRKFYIQLIKIIGQFEPVNLIVPKKDFLNSEERDSLKNTPFKVTLIPMKTDDIWIRDYGPFFIKKGKRIFVTEAKFNGWGEKFPPWKNDNLIPAHIAKKFGYKQVKSIPYILEGGAIEVNGDGLGMTTLDCLIGKKRNKPKDLDKIIKAICELFGLKDLLVLPKGLIGDHTDGHIDNLARFISNDKVVLASAYSNSDKNKKYLEECKVVIKAFLKKHYRKKYKVETIPLPPQRKLSDGQILPASYMNFILLNGALIYPKYQTKNDILADRFFRKAFSKRKVIGIDSRTVIEEGGSLHCITKQESA